MININYRDSRPIYEQIKDGLKRLIMAGGIKKDEKLPSVRDMAAQMSINPNTIQRAYRELEEEGFTYSVSGKGSFVSDVSELHQKMKEDFLEKLKESISELIELGVAEEEIQCYVNTVLFPINRI